MLQARSRFKYYKQGNFIMTWVANFFNNVLKSIPVLLAKVGTVLLFIFTAGLLGGYFVAIAGINPLIFLIPVVAMVVMWYKLDEGVLVLLLLTLVVVFFPEVVNSLFSAVP